MAVPQVVVVVAARHASERLPGKVFAYLDGQPVLERVIGLARMIGYPVKLTAPVGQKFPVFIDVVTGPENDLIRRHLLASEGFQHVVRVTGDCPFLDPWAARCTIHTHLEGGYDLTVDDAEGRGVQVYTRHLLEVMDMYAQDSYEREHLDVWPLRHESLLNVHHMKFSIDTPAELDLARRRVTL